MPLSFFSKLKLGRKLAVLVDEPLAFATLPLALTAVGRKTSLMSQFSGPGLDGDILIRL